MERKDQRGHPTPRNETTARSSPRSKEKYSDRSKILADLAENEPKVFEKSLFRKVTNK